MTEGQQSLLARAGGEARRSAEFARQEAELSWPNWQDVAVCWWHGRAADRRAASLEATAARNTR